MDEIVRKLSGGKQVASKWQASGKQVQNHVDGASIPQPFQKVENGLHVGKQVAGIAAFGSTTRNL